MYKLIALDMDGTLLTPEGRISPRTQAAIAAARARGVTVVLVTSKAAAATVEHLLDTIETHDDVATLVTPQTEDPEDVARTDGTEPGLPAAPSVTEASATVPTEAQK